MMDSSRPRWLKGVSRTRLELACTVITPVFMAAGWAAQHTAGLAAVWANVLYGLAYAFGGVFGVRATFLSLKKRQIDVDLLMILAALGAAVVDRFFEGAMLLFLFSLSNVLQDFAMDRTRRAIRALMKLRPASALVQRDGFRELVPIQDLGVGDIVLVRPGESVPLDGIIVEGESAIDESSLTGESIPVLKRTGSPVFAATINQGGALEIRVLRLARDSAVEKLIRMVERAQTEKASTQRTLDRVERYYAAGVILFTLGLIVGPLLLGAPFDATFYRAMTVMVVASPCALIISTPASILSAIGGAARQGVLFKGGVHLERLALVEVVAMDKTGTLTEGKPVVTDVVLADEALDADALLQLAGSVESKSEHPLASAVAKEVERRKLSMPDCTEFQSVTGKGAHARVEGRRILVGSERFFADFNGERPEDFAQKVAALHDAGKTCILVGEIDEHRARVLGAIAIADVLREGAAEVVSQLKALGVKKIVILTGDHPRVASAMARQAGVDEFHAALMPEDKVRIIKALAGVGPVVMVGDGVNDAPALATASVGMAMGAAGADVAMETADVVLMGSSLGKIPFALAIARKARRVVAQNLFFATSVIGVLVFSALGFSLPLPLGVIGHEGSTVLVCLNGLRLLAFRDGFLRPARRSRTVEPS